MQRCKKKGEIKKDETWNAGSYEYKSLKIEGKNTITIKGDVVLYVKDDFIMEKQTGFRILDNSSLTIYVDKKVELGKKFTTEFPNSPDRPEDFLIFGTSNADTVKIDKKSTFIGGIYAPDAKVEIEEKSDLLGSLVGDEIKIAKKSNVVWDEDMISVSTPGNGKVTLSDPVQYFSQ